MGEQRFDEDRGIKEVVGSDKGRGLSGEADKLEWPLMAGFAPSHVNVALSQSEGNSFFFGGSFGPRIWFLTDYGVLLSIWGKSMDDMELGK
jgi:hypothetical protein